MLGGDDYFNGRGQNGAGLHFLGPITATGGEGSESLLRGSSDPDVLDGGPGNDVIRGEESADVITGGPGDDTIGAGDGDDMVTGGAGLDSYAGSSGNDVFYAQDDEADTQLSGGRGYRHRLRRHRPRRDADRRGERDRRRPAATAAAHRAVRL